MKYSFLPNSETVIFTELHDKRNNDFEKTKIGEFCRDDKLQKTKMRTLDYTYTISTAWYRYTTFSALQTGYRSTCKTIILSVMNLMKKFVEHLTYYKMHIVILP